MAVQTESARLGDLLKWEQDNRFSREKVIVASGENLSLGHVVGLVTASEEVVELAPAATDGSEAAYGVLIEACDASAAAQDSVIVVRDAWLMETYLVWPSGITDPQKATALAQLKAKGIVVREEG